MTIDEALYFTAKILDSSLVADRVRSAAYAKQLADKLVSDGQEGLAVQLQQVLSRRASSTGAVAIARVGAAQRQEGSPRLPVDSESRIALADESNPERRPIFLPHAATEAVSRFVSFVRAVPKLAAQGLAGPACLLLSGPPGCGKTHLAKHIAAELELPLLTARSDALVSSYLGSTSKNLRMLFDHAAARPCVLFLDEFDALAKMRDDSRELGELKRVVISLLQNIDALRSDHVLIAATNHEHLLDAAVFRRFSFKLRLGLPEFDARRALFTNHCGQVIDTDDIDLLAAAAETLSGATIRSVCENARRDAVVRDLDKVPIAQLLSAVLADRRHADPDMPSDVPNVIRFLRKRDPKRFTQQHLSRMFEISQPQISRLLAQQKGLTDGKRRPTADQGRARKRQ